MEETIGTPAMPDDGRPQLTRRSDDVGRLAWRLVGDERNPPDPSAAPPLLDAMADAGLSRSGGHRLREELVRLARRFSYTEGRTADVRAAVSHWQEELHRLLTPLLWDLDSALALTAWAVDRCRAAPPPVETGRAELTVVWVDVGRAAVGTRVTLDDGRRGTVVVATRADGKSGVSPHDGGPEPGDDPRAYSANSPEWPEWW